MPAREYDSKLRAVLSYYYSVVNVTPEGDSLVSGETLQGIGTDDSSRSFLHALFGSILRVAFPSMYSRGPLEPEPEPGPQPTPQVAEVVEELLDAPVEQPEMMDQEAARKPTRAEPNTTTEDPPQTLDEGLLPDREASGDGTLEDEPEEQPVEASRTEPKKKFRLTSFIPHSGYFVAGAIAGGVSRTVTAPLDRLKVYLLVKTSTTSETALAAIKQGRPAAALKNATRPFRDAVVDVYASGGFRGFFAGRRTVRSRVTRLSFC